MAKYSRWHCQGQIRKAHFDHTNTTPLLELKPDKLAFVIFCAIHKNKLTTPLTNEEWERNDCTKVTKLQARREWKYLDYLIYQIKKTFYHWKYLKEWPISFFIKTPLADISFIFCLCGKFDTNLFCSWSERCMDI